MPHSPITRRELLKAILAAGGGLTASAMLPAKWLKPVVKSGVLPVHAQTSIQGRIVLFPPQTGFGDGTYTLSIMVVVTSELNSFSVSTDQVGSSFLPGIPGVKVTFDYEQVVGTVTNPVPNLSRWKITDNDGLANFGSQTFTVSEDFWLKLIFTAPGCDPTIEEFGTQMP
jgi:hypothetical protein